MRRFNPEKELRKIQYGGRNRILYGIIALLLIISIGSTYALYQVRYSKRIIYTKVAPFSTDKDIELAVNIKGEDGSIETIKEFPKNDDEYAFTYEGIECDIPDITTATWGKDRLIVDTLGPNKCIVTFKKQKYKPLSDKIVKNNTTIFADEVENLRYAGASDKVNNYIWFNCNDYIGLNQTTAEQKCEKWRIIGLFKNIKKANGETEDLIKIIRSESLGNGNWDSSGTSGSNVWSIATLKKNLNIEYLLLNTIGDFGSFTKNSSYKPITTQASYIIEEVTWNIGGMDSYSSATVTDFYATERGNKTYSGSSTWNGYIGLMYPSDYGYATGGGNTKSRSDCLEIVLNKWNESEYKENCVENDWLYIPDNYQWTITQNSSHHTSSIAVNPDGNIGDGRNGTWSNGVVRPVLYLNASIPMVSGDGNPNGEGPYILVP